MQTSCAGSAGLINRRDFLIFGGTSVSVVATLALAKDAKAQSADLIMSRYPVKRIVSLAELEPRQPVRFTYPTEDVHNFVVKLGERAGQGLGPDEDIVAFNTVCPHMGGPVGPEVYKPDHAIVGPCPLHLTSFDLTKHGMVVSGQATASLPQIALSERDGEIYAVGVMGLVYGYHENPTENA